nr:RNA-directed DNA polymerase, eukaryota, reverse transcriptase zinc-binding domain protein [Tanacetum cinerariifolium]
MRNMTGKLKFLRSKIGKWIKDNRCNRKVAFDKLKEDLRLVDEAIDKGVGTEEVVNKRVEVLNSLRYIDQMHAMDLAQKAKIKWSIEEQPNDVKQEFLNHFQERFDKPVEQRVTINTYYPRSISGEQRDELERKVTIEEIKTAVWNCGLKINLCKSKIIGVNVEGSYVNQAVVKLGCQVLTSPFIYLGTKVGGTIGFKHGKRSWKKVPSRVLQILESVRRCFFNGHEIGNIKVSGLMIKWLWKFFVHKDSIWTKVIMAIHGVNGNINSSGEKAGRSCWLAIVDEVRALHKKMVRGGILKDLFPRMFALKNIKEVTVSSKLNGDNLADSFRRSPRGN